MSPPQRAPPDHPTRGPWSPHPGPVLTAAHACPPIPHEWPLHQQSPWHPQHGTHIHKCLSTERQTVVAAVFLRKQLPGSRTPWTCACSLLGRPSQPERRELPPAVCRESSELGGVKWPSESQVISGQVWSNAGPRVSKTAVCTRSLGELPPTTETVLRTVLEGPTMALTLCSRSAGSPAAAHKTQAPCAAASGPDDGLL